mmetsp:Transcript_111252/g.237729  ORF Transcript_111252/g.237729 Transcript_111252/m.237729 type:complete len:152 (+) Transcript_111252:84-539(+)
MQPQPQPQPQAGTSPRTASPRPAFAAAVVYNSGPPRFHAQPAGRGIGLCASPAAELEKRGQWPLPPSTPPKLRLPRAFEPATLTSPMVGIPALPSRPRPSGAGPQCSDPKAWCPLEKLGLWRRDPAREVLQEEAGGDEASQHRPDSCIVHL